MSRVNRTAAILIVWPALLAPLLQVQAQSLPELEKELKANPGSLEAQENLAEAYLRECFLEKSLKLWKAIRAQNPDHARARTVTERLTLQALDLDSHLEILRKLIEKGATDGMASMLRTSAERAATDEQKANILYLRGLLAREEVAIAAARASLEAAIKLYPDTAWAGRSAIALADLESGTSRECAPVKVPALEEYVGIEPLEEQPGHPARQGDTDEARRLLLWVAEQAQGQPDEVREEAQFRLLMLDFRSSAGPERVAALQKLLASTTVPRIKRSVLWEQVRATNSARRGWSPESIALIEQLLKTEPTYAETRGILRQLLDVSRDSQDVPALDRVLSLLGRHEFQEPSLHREGAFVRIDTLLSRAALDEDPNAMSERVAEARKAAEALSAELETYQEQRRLADLLGRAYLVEGQKLVALQSTTHALPVLLKARDHYLSQIGDAGPDRFTRLQKIGRLLEQVREWESAVLLYRGLATSVPHLPEGRDALMKVARIYEQQLDAPIDAIEVYAEYAARYPAELTYRQLRVGERLDRLGFTNVLDFQKRNGLKPDGVFGPVSRLKLDELESSFDAIRVKRGTSSETLRGVFVHPMIFAIARRLEEAGRHHDAIQAYRAFLCLFPTKREADDALISIARLFRSDLLFEEALGAYAELMEDYPKGNLTSEAYVEAAECLENLGQWQEAKEHYELYLKKFPRFAHVERCKQRIARLQDVQQYQDFLETNPQSPKAAEAQYQIGQLLYKEFKNHTKAAVEFKKVPERHPDHARAAEGLFSAGTALLWAENFPAARAEFEALVERYPDTRLADDAQYWVGHTYEYSARALGKLDRKRIVLKRRALDAREHLLTDLPLRKLYFPEAKPGPARPEAVWGGDALGVLTSGSKRDRVNAELFRAIRAYRKVVEQFKMGDMAGNALLRVGAIYMEYLKDPDQAVATYQELLEHYPGSREAVDALYEVGGYLLKKKEFDKALKSLRQFTYNYPTDKRVEDAMLSIARAYVEKKDWHKALDAYQSYLNKYPQGKNSTFAKAQVEWIRLYYF